MPVCTIHLLSLSAPLSQFLAALSQARAPPLVVSKVFRWIIKPTKFSVDPLSMQSPPCDVLVIYAKDKELPGELKTMVKAEWTVRAGIPSSILNNFAEKNQKLLHPSPKDVPPIDKQATKDPKMGESAQSLELSPELREWVQHFGTNGPGTGAVSMLNLLAFKEGKKEEYLKYGQEFAKTIGSRHGGNAKLVGTVIECSSTPKGVKEWHEIALAHYPSINHFAAMLASEDYQETNHKHRLPSLEDTFIICTSELALPSAYAGAGGPNAKL